MRIRKEQAAENRLRILAAAERLFREHGMDAVSLADLMQEAGFTHGGFYNHFVSKDELAAAACAHALTTSRATLDEALASDKSRAWHAYARQYVSSEHRDHPENGCTLGALAADASRQDEDVQAAFAEHIEHCVAQLSAHLARTTPGQSSTRLRVQALRTWSELVGALVLSRAVADAAPELSDELLSATRRAIREVP